MKLSPSHPPSKAEVTTCPIESPADVFAKTETIYPTIYHQLREKPFKWVKQDERKNYIVNPSHRYRRIQTIIKSHLERFAPASRYSLHGVPGGFRSLQLLRGFYDILVVDLQHAFEHVKFTRVCGLLRYRGIEPAHEYARYTCYNGSLMRGSICSNQILESLLIRLDYRLAGLARLQNFFMKRYIDEYWFYGDFRHKNLTTHLYDVQRAVRAEGFMLNRSKTYIELHADIEAFTDGSRRPNQSRGGFLRSNE